MILQLVNEMTNQKEESIKNKNQALLKKIKKFEKQNQSMKGQVNQAILMQLAGGNPNALPAMMGSSPGALG